MAPQSVEAQAARVVDGMLNVGRHLRAAKPDVLVIVTSDHLFNVRLGTPSRFLVGTGASFTPFGEMDVPRETYLGHPSFAHAFVDFAAARGVSIDRIDPLNPDHGTAVPLLFANPDRDIPVVPLLVNYTCETVPEPEECWQFGLTLADFIASVRPAAERVALLGAGGLSHWVGYPESNVNEAFDREFLAAVERGELKPWRARSAASIEREAGNGGLEIMSWLAALAAAPGARARIAYYEPMLAWMTGMGGALLQLNNTASS
jgi:protocatechuate 4,5-dioxygenase beta chain/2'-aminobiphenyl-2,3-diol 1,2-dioxygenase large subunit